MSNGNFDHPNTEENPYPLQLDHVFVTTAGHGAFWMVNDKPCIVQTLTGFIGADNNTKQSTIQIAFQPDAWDAMVAFVERMKARNPGWPENA